MSSNGPTAFLRFDVEEFVSFLKAILSEVEAGVACAALNLTGRAVTVREMLQLALTGNREHIPPEEQDGSFYIVHLDDFSEAKHHMIFVYESSSLFPTIRQRHHSSGHA